MYISFIRIGDHVKIWTLVSRYVAPTKTLVISRIIISTQKINKAQLSINFINRKGKFNISFKSFQQEIEIQILHY